MKVFGWVVLAFFAFIALWIASIAFDWFGQAVQVVQQEVAPAELLRKYSWFKNAAAALDDKAASIDLYGKRVKNFEEMYKGTPRKDWPRDDREQYGQITTELLGLKASFNSLAAEYNAQMAKINWRFCNVGDLPRGADKVLPREYRAYLTD
jgi:two-component SAPR family response regulator